MPALDCRVSLHPAQSESENVVFVLPLSLGFDISDQPVHFGKAWLRGV